MIDLTEEYKDKGFFIISPIYYQNRVFVKCGNKKNDYIYYFEIKDGTTLEIKDEDILNLLQKRYNYKSNTKILN